MKSLFLVIALSVVASAQVPCPLTKPPTLRGLHLGMTLTDVQKVYPSAERSSYPDLGEPFISLSRPADGVRDIHMTLSAANQVKEIMVTYTDDIAWDSVQEFAYHASPFLGIPLKYWYCPAILACSRPSTQRQLSCKGFELAANIFGNEPVLRLSYPQRAEIVRSHKQDFRP